MGAAAPDDMRALAVAVAALCPTILPPQPPPGSTHGPAAATGHPVKVCASPNIASPGEPTWQSP